MNINIVNKDKFPHIYGLQKFGGQLTPEGEKYYEEHEEELKDEYELLMHSLGERFNIGDNKSVHGIYNHGQ